MSEEVSLSELIRAHLAYGGLTYSMEVEEPLMREIPVSDVVISVLKAVDEWLDIPLDSDLTEVELVW